MSIYNLTEDEEKALAKAREVHPFNLNKFKYETISRNDLVGAFLELRTAPSQLGQGQTASKIWALHGINAGKEKLELLKQIEQLLRSDELDHPDDIACSKTKADILIEMAERQSKIVEQIISDEDFVLLCELEGEINAIINEAISMGRLSAFYPDGAKTKDECIEKQLDKIKKALEKTGITWTAEGMGKTAYELSCSDLANAFKIIDVIDWPAKEKKLDPDFPLQLPDELVEYHKERNKARVSYEASPRESDEKIICALLLERQMTNEEAKENHTKYVENLMKNHSIEPPTERTIRDSLTRAQKHSPTKMPFVKKLEKTK